MCVVMCQQVVYVLIGSKKLYCRVLVCVVVCWQVISVSTGSRKIVLLSVGVCRHVLAGCLCVGRFKKNWIVECQCVLSCVGRLFMCRTADNHL